MFPQFYSRGSADIAHVPCLLHLQQSAGAAALAAHRMDVPDPVDCQVFAEIWPGKGEREKRDAETHVLLMLD